MNDLIELIASRKLSISFSKFAVYVFDGTTKTTYIEYYTTPLANANKALVHPTCAKALEVAFSNCSNNITSTSEIVMSNPGI